MKEVKGEMPTEEIDKEAQLTDFETEEDEEIATPAEEESELEIACRERDEYYDRLLRKQAEFDNYRKRLGREKGELRVSVEADILSELLPIIDACEKGLNAMESGTDELPAEVFVEGYDLLLKQLRSVLEKYDVKEVPGEGATFDPNVHEALVREVTKEQDEDSVIEEYRKGYTIGNRLLRPAQVKVAVWPEE